MQKSCSPLPAAEVLQLLQQLPPQQKQLQQQLRELYLEHLLLQGLLHDPQIETELASIYIDRGAQIRG